MINENETIEERNKKLPMFQSSRPRLNTIVPIILFSYLGTAIRLAFNQLGDRQYPLTACFWSNMFGCFIMGMIIEQKAHIQEQFVIESKCHLVERECFFFSSFHQLYVGLTTGLCGSITTFSGAMYYSCVGLFEHSALYSYSVSNYLSIMISLFSSSFIGFLMGRHLSHFLLPASSIVTMKRVLLKMKDHGNRWFFPILISISLPTSIILTVLLPIGRWTYFIYSIVFCPLGSLSRYLLSVVFNFNPQFPLGTLLANLCGSLIYFGVVAISQYVKISSFLLKQILIGILQGYCGCLTTVSTLITELNTIESKKYLYFYVIVTFVPIQIVYISLASVFSSICS